MAIGRDLMGRLASRRLAPCLLVVMLLAAVPDLAPAIAQERVSPAR